MAGGVGFTVTVRARSRLSNAETRSRDEARKTTDVLQRAFGDFTTEELAALRTNLERYIAPMDHDPVDSELLSEATRGAPIPGAATVALEMAALQRRAAARARLLEGALTTEDVRKLLGARSRQTPHDHLKRGDLLAITVGGEYRFPVWQFNPERPGQAWPGLPRVLRALPLDPLGKAYWLARPNPYLDSRTPLDAIRAGDIDVVMANLPSTVLP